MISDILTFEILLLNNPLTTKGRKVHEENPRVF